MKKIFKGFTLAEVLISLGIIGIIASLTLPNLNTNIQRQQLGVAVSKNYAQLTNALHLYMAQNGAASEIDFNQFNDATFTRRYLNIRQECDNNATCFADTYTYINNRENTITFDEISEGDVAYRLQDGTSFQMDGRWIIIDVNGRRGPNTVGYDLHALRLNRDGSLGPTNNERLLPRQAEVARNLDACRNGSALPQDINEENEDNEDFVGKSTFGGCFEHLMRNDFRINY